MSIARWGWNNGELAPQVSGPFVRYADHVAALRACEARQRIEARAEGYAMGHIDGDTHGYAAGLDAARDAVAEKQRTYVAQGLARPGEADGYLAAIDALRGES